MKSLSRVVLGSVAGCLLGAAAFFAVDALMPSKAEAHDENSEIHTTAFVQLSGATKLSNGGSTLHSCNVSFTDPTTEILNVYCYD